MSSNDYSIDSNNVELKNKSKLYDHPHHFNTYIQTWHNYINTEILGLKSKDK